MFVLSDYVDLGRYPLDRRGGEAYEAMLASTRAALADDGCAVLPGFVHAGGVEVLVREAGRVSPCAFRSFNRTNVYFSRDDETLPPEHPVRRFYPRTNSFVPADNFAAGSPLRGLYQSAEFMPFIHDALEEKAFYRYADPLADVIINVVEAGEEEEGGFPWHFDTNNYTVTLALQNAGSGGVFEYCPNLRQRDGENYEGVARVLDGDSDEVVKLPLGAGDLQIFRGRYSLHRVTSVRGPRPRYVAIFSFASVPDLVASPERCRQLYGRVLPIHLERARADSLRD